MYFHGTNSRRYADDTGLYSCIDAPHNLQSTFGRTISKVFSCKRKLIDIVDFVPALWKTLEVVPVINVWVLDESLYVECYLNLRFLFWTQILFLF